MLSEQINVRIPTQLKRDLQDRGVNPHEIARKAWEEALGGQNDLGMLMKAEEDKFADWADSFVRLYQYLNHKLRDKESLVLAEMNKLEELWGRVEHRMKTREQLMEEVPELKELTYHDCFDWVRLFKILAAYPMSLKGKLGLVQIREAVLFREVKAGNFKTIQDAREKLRKDLDMRIEIAKKELTEWTQSEEYKKQYLLKQEELLIEKQKMRQEAKS